MSTTRQYWLETMQKIAYPVLSALSRDCLRAELPLEGKDIESRSPFALLEAFGRTMCGIAPFLDAGGLTGEEASMQAEFSTLARRAIHFAVTPGSRDYLNFSDGYQPIVDAAFLAHAILRAPDALWAQLPADDRSGLVAQMKKTRTRKPGPNNWLLFSAMIETFLFFAGEPDWDPMRIDYALRQHMAWYLGDGIYGDGPHFHADYYNSFVISPMLTDILRVMAPTHGDWAEMLPAAIKRSARLATNLERLIAPDGSYPAIGRSLAYRFGAFQMLAQAALEGILEDTLPPSQVRCALTAVIERIMAFDNFDENGWLKIGICGHQPGLGEGYINTGSVYLCCAVFLPLGLAPDHPFWAGEDLPWTQKRIWSGEDFPCQHSID